MILTSQTHFPLKRVITEQIHLKLKHYNIFVKSFGLSNVFNSKT